MKLRPTTPKAPNLEAFKGATFSLITSQGAQRVTMATVTNHHTINVSTVINGGDKFCFIVSRMGAKIIDTILVPVNWTSPYEVMANGRDQPLKRKIKLEASRVCAEVSLYDKDLTPKPLPHAKGESLTTISKDLAVLQGSSMRSPLPVLTIVGTKKAIGEISLEKLREAWAGDIFSDLFVRHPSSLLSGKEADWHHLLDRLATFYPGCFCTGMTTLIKGGELGLELEVKTVGTTVVLFQTPHDWKEGYRWIKQDSIPFKKDVFNEVDSLEALLKASTAHPECAFEFITAHARTAYDGEGNYHEEFIDFTGNYDWANLNKKEVEERAKRS